MGRYRKAIVAGILAGVVVAAQHYSIPWLQVAAAVASPIAVYMARNDL